MGAAQSVAAASAFAEAPAPAPVVAEAEAPVAPHAEDDWSWRRVELGKWAVSGVDVVGVGAHCVVRRGIEEGGSGRAVAVKEYVGAGAGARLAREVRTLAALAAVGPRLWDAALDHTRASGGDAGADAATGRCLAVLPLAEAGTLDDVVQRGEPVVGAIVARVIADVAAALACMHGVGLVHGDVKPANVLRYGPGWRLIDVDDALDARGSAATAKNPFYTELYASPEVARAAAVDAVLVVAPAIDAWSLGVTAAEALRGAHPLRAAIDGRGDAFLGWLGGLRQAAVDDWLGDGDAVLGAVLRSCCAVDPAARAPLSDVADRAETAARSLPPAPATPPRPKPAAKAATAFSIFRDDSLPELVASGSSRLQAMRTSSKRWAALKKDDPEAVSAFEDRARDANAAREPS